MEDPKDELLSQTIQRALWYSAGAGDRIDYEQGVGRYVVSARAVLRQAAIAPEIKATLSVFLTKAFEQVDTPQDASRRVPELIQTIKTGTWEDLGGSADDLGGPPTDELRAQLAEMLGAHAGQFIDEARKELA